MRSVAGLGLGVIALTAGAFITAGASAGHRSGVAAALQRSSYFEASVEGGTSARPAGSVAHGLVGDSASGIAAFTITLSGADSSGAILFTRISGGRPLPGRYEVSDTAGPGGFRALYVAGSAERPTGLFRGQRGTLEITAASADRLSGHFSFTGAGFLATDPSDEGSEVLVAGSFMSTHVPAGQPAQP
jgi:hypothetical protein